jgi:tetratricopeptide (TPR) repeat protein
MSGYAVAHLEEIDEISDGRCPKRPVRHHFGITAFGVNAWTGREAGDRIINELDGERVDAPAGTFVFARPSVKRTAFAEESGTTIVALGGVPGKAYEPYGNEVWAPLRPLYESGQYAEVADRLRAELEAHPEYTMLFYNLACSESLAGRKADAIEHLRVAVERSDQWRSLAAEDSDLDPIRDDRAFKELIGS